MGLPAIPANIRRKFMARFFSCQNNGTIAVIREDHAKQYGLIRKSGGDPTKAGVRVFTFSNSEGYRGLVTGTYTDLAFLVSLGHEIVSDTGNDWTGYVPFSNGVDIAQRELEYRTTLSDLIELFLQSTADSLKKAS
jgi:hypothetical protein